MKRKINVSARNQLDAGSAPEVPASEPGWQQLEAALLAFYIDGTDSIDWAELYQKLQYMAKRSVIAFGLSIEIADDVVQEVLLALFKRTSIWHREQGPLAAYLWQAVRNKVISYLRQAGRLDPLDEEPVESLAPPDTELQSEDAQPGPLLSKVISSDPKFRELWEIAPDLEENGYRNQQLVALINARRAQLAAANHTTLEPVDIVYVEKLKKRFKRRYYSVLRQEIIQRAHRVCECPMMSCTEHRNTACSRSLQEDWQIHVKVLRRKSFILNDVIGLCPECFQAASQWRKLEQFLHNECSADQVNWMQVLARLEHVARDSGSRRPKETVNQILMQVFEGHLNWNPVNPLERYLCQAIRCQMDQNRRNEQRFRSEQLPKAGFIPPPEPAV